MESGDEVRTKPGKLSKYCRFVLVPVLMLLVVPFYIYIPVLQRQQLLNFINKTVTLAQDRSLYGA